MGNWDLIWLVPICICPDIGDTSCLLFEKETVFSNYRGDYIEKEKTKKEERKQLLLE